MTSPFLTVEAVLKRLLKTLLVLYPEHRLPVGHNRWLLAVPPPAA